VKYLEKVYYHFTLICGYCNKIYDIFQQFYPVNYLRNVAMNQTQTSHLFLTDIDFLPMYDLYKNLKSIVSRIDMEKEIKVSQVKHEKYIYILKCVLIPLILPCTI
jgi:hypothetical protein